MNNIRIKKSNRVLRNLIIIFFVYVVSYSFVNNFVYSQNNQEVKYFKNIDKTHYYIQFVNEIPYFRVNRYNQYYEVIYINDNISEVLFYRNNSLVERMNYSYPERGKTHIDYYGISNNEEEVLTYYEVYYYDMGLLTKKENYSSDEKLSYYVEIDYNGHKPIKEYYLDSNDTYIYKFYYYEGDIIRYVLRRGIVYDYTSDKNNNTIINEKWIYQNKSISSLEKYNGSNIAEKYYFNQYGNIIKKEIYNDLQRIDKYFIYKYDDYTKLSVISKYETDDPYYSFSRKSNIIESYHLLNNKIIKREYLDNIIEKETVIIKDLEIVSEKIYYQSGKLKEINYYDILNNYEIEGYSKIGENVKYTINADNQKNIILTVNNKEPTLLNLEDEHSEFRMFIYDENKILSDNLLYSPTENKLIINEYENNTIINSKLYFIMDSYDDYLSSLNLNPENHIIIFPPDNEL